MLFKLLQRRGCGAKSLALVAPHALFEELEQRNNLFRYGALKVKKPSEHQNQRRQKVLPIYTDDPQW